MSRLKTVFETPQETQISDAGDPYLVLDHSAILRCFESIRDRYPDNTNDITWQPGFIIKATEVGSLRAVYTKPGPTKDTRSLPSNPDAAIFRSGPPLPRNLTWLEINSYDPMGYSSKTDGLPPFPPFLPLANIQTTHPRFQQQINEMAQGQIRIRDLHQQLSLVEN